MERLLAGRYQAVWGFKYRKRAGSDRRSGAKWVKHIDGLGLRCSVSFFVCNSLDLDIKHWHAWSLRVTCVICSTQQWTVLVSAWL